MKGPSSPADGHNEPTMVLYRVHAMRQCPHKVIGIRADLIHEITFELFFDRLFMKSLFI